MNKKNREKKSADAYLNFLQSKGAPTSLLYARSHFLDTFGISLKDKDQTRIAYANALQNTRKKLSKEHKDLLTIAREYFPFWMEDIKAIANFEKKFGFNALDSNWEPKPKSLKSLESAIKTDVYTIHEKQALNSYLEKIGKVINDFQSTNERLDLAKILLIRLRDAPDKNHNFYRKAIDITLPLFECKNKRKLYLEVARELYDDWKKTQKTYA